MQCQTVTQCCSSGRRGQLMDEGTGELRTLSTRPSIYASARFRDGSPVAGTGAGRDTTARPCRDVAAAHFHFVATTLHHEMTAHGQRRRPTRMPTIGDDNRIIQGTWRVDDRCFIAQECAKYLFFASTTALHILNHKIIIYYLKNNLLNMKFD